MGKEKGDGKSRVGKEQLKEKKGKEEAKKITKRIKKRES